MLAMTGGCAYLFFRSEQVLRDVAQDLLRGIASGDSATACHALSRKGEEALLDRANDLVGGRKSATCEEAVIAIYESLSEQQRSALLSVEMTAIPKKHQAGSAATARLQEANALDIASMELRKIDGRWMVAEFAFGYERPDSAD